MRSHSPDSDAESGEANCSSPLAGRGAAQAAGTGAGGLQDGGPEPLRDYLPLRIVVTILTIIFFM